MFRNVFDQSCPRNVIHTFLLLSVFFLTVALPSSADLTLQGPSGFIQVPSAKTIHAGGIEWAAHTRMFQAPGTRSDHFLTDLALGFSPIRDLEIGVEKAIDSRRGKDDFDPDPTVNVKVRLPPMGGEFSETALGLLLDTNPNNYHTLYFSVGGLGLGWNFGGNPGSGIAHFGEYDRGRKAPKSLCLLVGGDLNPGNPDERGYRGHAIADYNGDVFSIGWRFKNYRGFWVDLAAQSKSSYTDIYNYQPIIFGVGAIF
ncbi:MAG: hypothetical protein HQM09_08995 [Candidatus Riflebacteria bacterium]|nr:hypothetical protein [Candidatus Riflebacteria bacterium]